MADAKVDAQQIFEAAINSPLPRIYFNGHVMAWTPVDASIVLQLNNSPTALLFGSYENWKSFAHAILRGIEDVENKAGVEFSDFETIARKLEASSDVPKA